jgi:chloride channel 3/4/5
MDRDVEVIHIERLNTVRTLRDQLAKLVGAGFTDTGFPILRGEEDGSSRMVGFIGGSELEHALSTPRFAHLARVFLLINAFF